MDRAIGATKRLVKILVVELLTKCLGSWMVRLEFLIVRKKAVKIPALVAELCPVI